MSRQYKIRWDDRTQRETQRIVRNYNRRVQLVINKNPKMLEFLPPKISVKEIKSRVVTRQDLNRELNRLERFRSDKLELVPVGNIFVTQYEKREMEIARRNVNIKRAYKRKQNFGVRTYDNLYRQADEEKASLIPHTAKLDYFKSRKEWDKRFQSFDLQLRGDYYSNKIQAYSENYRQAIINNFGVYAEKLLEYISDISEQDLFDAGRSNPLLEITFVYGAQDTEFKAENLLNVWAMYKGDDNFDSESYLYNE
jgi:hypothetical protein